jgi:hypothetical protein
MTTNIYLGFPFGMISVASHLALLCIDPRPTYKFYNLSLFLWVLGNFIWMTIEFTCVQPSSRVHVGPHVPLGGIDADSQFWLVNFKTVLFFVGAITQISMYVLIYCNRMEMPADDDDDIVSRNEAQLLLRGGARVGFAADSDHTTLNPNSTSSGSSQEHDHDQDVSYDITLAFVENAYIIFWISKDLFWSWGTGDLTRGYIFAVSCESAAMGFGFLAMCVYLTTSYICRRNWVHFLDAITTVCWIAANYTWMCGEFFLRYNNLQYDDTTEGDDWTTRVGASVLFSTGIAIQLYVILHMSLKKLQVCQGGPGSRRSSLCCGPKGGSKNSSTTSMVEMFDIGAFRRAATSITTSTPMSSPSGAKGSNKSHMPVATFNPQDDFDDDIESVVLF